MKERWAEEKFQLQLNVISIDTGDGRGLTLSRITPVVLGSPVRYRRSSSTLTSHKLSRKILSKPLKMLQVSRNVF